MITRRQAREWALQILADFELNPPDDLDAALPLAWQILTDAEADDLEEQVLTARIALTARAPRQVQQLAEMKQFAEARVRGVLADCAHLDELIAPCLRNWSLYRLGLIERNALRMGVWELLNCPDIPRPIIINETVDVTKYFSENSAGRLVNGVMDALAKTIKREEGKEIREEGRGTREEEELVIG